MAITQPVDFNSISRQFLRAVRGRRSQVAFSRRLGFASNVAAEWESGRRIPALSTALGACERAGIDVVGAFRRFWPPTAPLLTGIDAATLAHWLDAMRGKDPVSTVARRTALSRHQVARILSGKTEPRLHQFFALVHACTGRLSDLVAECVDIELIGDLRGYHRRTTVSRRLAFEGPWTSALLSGLECIPDLERDQAEHTLSRTFGLSREEVARYLRHMVTAGVIARRKGRYVLSDPMVVDTGTASEAARRLARHWSDVGSTRTAAPHENDVFSFNVFSVSRADYLRLAEMQREYFQRVRAIIAKSAPEMVAVMNLQLLEFDSLANSPT